MNLRFFHPVVYNLYRIERNTITFNAKNVVFDTIGETSSTMVEHYFSSVDYYPTSDLLTTFWPSQMIVGNGVGSNIKHSIP